MYSPARFYKLLNALRGQTKSFEQFSALIIENKKITDKLEIANTFNNFFSEIVPKLSETIKARKIKLPQNVLKSIYIKPATEQEITDIIRKIDDKKATGGDGIPMKLVKFTAPILIPYLTALINKSYTEGIFPHSLKHARVTPIHKGGNTEDPNSYRPISILPTLSKIFERTMHTRIYKYFENFNLFYPRQFGFRNKHSTVDAIAEMTEQIREKRDKGDTTTAVFLDFKKAFDTVDHDILIQKLERYGIRGKSNKWIRSYLENRTQYVAIGESKSSIRQIKCGVPQGSILGPLLFLIYINDMNSRCNDVDTYHFADDTTLLDKNNGKNNDKLNQDLINVQHWLE